ncbi:autotransporter outer membrane beta-barrel domain-containing protein [Enterobacteriaceae bacterium BIT-l23]|uniref:autotransporter outer membrane beta-barrel domain-containing protein n=1 Tax=Jejubacter sp. L23 TaxID=3092086 RepID=UPI001584DC08|nr:autotransporter outer membrane beta-barrel domain-containing protein [Enterobacteriaceae bacterium BIT-l23]
MNRDDMPVSGTIADSTVHGGIYGVYIGTDPRSDNPAGVTNLELDHSLVSGDGGAAIRVGNGATLNLELKNGTQLTGRDNILASVDSGSQLNLSVTNAGLTGNLLNNEGGTENVSLNKDGMLTGMMQGISSLTLAKESAWNLTGNSTIAGNVANDGTISLAYDSTPGTVLTVGGNYTGNNGNLLFNTALGGDNSPTDKLEIKGNAGGSTNVSVTNAGGTGNKTLDGIELIHVDGTATDGAFKQKGRIVAGMFDYTLDKKGNSWVLDSSYSGPNPGPIPGPNPGPNPGPDPIPDDHRVRPEAGTYIANQAASSMFLTTLHDRAGENRYMNVLDNAGNVTSLWLRQVGTHNRFRDSTGQLRTTGNTWVAQLGGDLAQWSSDDHDRFHLGLMAGYGNSHNNTQSSVSGHGSKGSVTGYSVGLYGTWYQNDADNTGAYVDSQVMYSWFDNHVNGDDISSEKYKSKGVTASVETGYTLAVGQSGAQDNPTRYFIEPQAQVTWMGVKADDLTEANGTRVSSQGNDNAQTRLGMRAFMKGHRGLDTAKNRTFQPFVEVNWLHNTKRNGVTMNGVSLEQAGATNIGEMKLGVEGQLTNRTALWGNVGQQLGDKGYSNTEATLGVKYSF